MFFNRSKLVWAALFAVLCLPLVAAATSPLLAWRQPVYIIAGFAGIIGMTLVPIQPLLITGRLPGLNGPPARRWHRLIGSALVLAIIIHVGGLWITSPPDVIDALLLRSPTPFSVWGVAAMWAAFAAALIAVLRRRMRPRVWRLAHLALVFIVAGGTVAHALLIEGTMEPISKWLLSALVILATLSTLRR